MDRKLLKVLRTDIDAALAAVAAKHGVTIQTGNCSFTPTDATFKLHVGVGSAEDAGQREFEKLCKHKPWLKLRPEMFGLEFTQAGKRYRVSGAAPKSPKYPVLATEVRSGRPFKFPAETIRMAAS